MSSWPFPSFWGRLRGLAWLPSPWWLVPTVFLTAAVATAAALLYLRTHGAYGATTPRDPLFIDGSKPEGSTSDPLRAGSGPQPGISVRALSGSDAVDPNAGILGSTYITVPRSDNALVNAAPAAPSVPDPPTISISQSIENPAIPWVKPMEANIPAPAPPLSIPNKANAPNPVASPAVSSTKPAPPPAFVPPRPIQWTKPDPHLAGLTLSRAVDVRVKIRIDATGRVTAAHALLDGSVRDDKLMAAAAATVRQWTFEPAKIHGANAASEEVVVVHFGPENK